MLQLPPLSLYIHIPWCIEKCPYCDFNSHKLRGEIPEQAYLEALLKDLKTDLFYVQGRILDTIFIGGGTPSLISAQGIGWLLKEVEQLIPFKENIEITLEANPGAIENSKIAEFYKAGVSRFSFGVQSFQQEKLTRLGRIHGVDEAKSAALQAKESGVSTFNLDLMHGLPDQSLEDALFDLQTAIDLKPTHLSWYQLTIEPNTQYFSHPPKLPEDELLWEIQEAGQKLLAEHGYRQYEISGYTQVGFECQHNINYWSFSDYLGIGCGAHGKLTLPLENKIIRTTKIKHPKGYLDESRPFLDDLQTVAQEDLAFEYMMNRMRLIAPIPFAEFEQYTGLSIDAIALPIQQAIDKQLLIKHSDHWLMTDLGHRYLNELLMLFMD
ncbi:radical SAM family heme chaperone HemW [Psychromonas sp. Urea-02u-13]|uniref:radical SAM family heme chaperone HemW n=1 Tax=Psychromonas sp. Urea-02u-13 TaxID=2058326 RepID=UPI000C341522|nr:radical SAM family heme chaperone HemW [Psychromonas sp. Urea-02u-13]PKG38803.1 YggW family oxidoreductase [Psychromonas sp. Urea-02u-13]